MYLLWKLAITTGLVLAVSELAKRSSLLGGLLASIPLVSVLAMIWLYVDTRSAEKVGALATSVFWMVLPSLSLFLLLPVLLRRGVRFYPSLTISILTMTALYVATVAVLRRLGVAIDG